MKVTALLALAALAGAATVLGFLPGALLPFTAGPAIALGCAWPVLRRLSPEEPSLLKLAVVSALVSAPAATALLAALEVAPGLALSPAHSLASALGLVAALALLGRRAGTARRGADPDPIPGRERGHDADSKRDRDSNPSGDPERDPSREPSEDRDEVRGRGGLGSAAWGALLLALVLAGCVAWIVLGPGAAARVLPPGAVWHAGVANLIARGGPLENPWLAGEPLPAHPGYGALAATIMRAFGLSAPRAMAWLGVSSLALLPIVLYLFAAPLWRDRWRAFLAPLVALLAWNAARGLTWPLAAPDSGGTVFSGMALFARPGSVAPALTLGAGAWMCAAHALRHGRAPWVGASATLAGFALALHPALGAATFAAVLAATLLAPVPAGVRSKLVIASALAAVPGALLAWRFGASAEPIRPHTAADQAAPWMVAAAPMVLLALVAVLGHVRRRGDHGEGGERRGRAILIRFMVCAVLAPFALSWTGLVGPLDARVLHRLASLPLGILAAGGAVDLLAGRIPARVLGTLVCGATALGAARAEGRSLQALLALARTPVPLVDDSGRVAPSASVDGLDAENAAARAAAYAWLRSQDELRARRPVFVRSVALDSNRVGGTFTPHVAGLYAELSMWCDRRFEFSPGSAVWLGRHERLHELYRDRSQWDPRMIQEFEHVGRPAIFLVEERDRYKTLRGAIDVPFRGVDNRLQRMGCKRIHVEGEVALYLWEPSPEAAR